MKRLGTSEPEPQLVSQTVKATPFMIPNEPSMAVSSSVATKSSSPDCVIPEQKTSPIHGGGWIRPSETNGDDGDTDVVGRVRS